MVNDNTVREEEIPETPDGSNSNQVLMFMTDSEAITPSSEESSASSLRFYPCTEALESPQEEDSKCLAVTGQDSPTRLTTTKEFIELSTHRDSTLSSESHDLLIQATSGQFSARHPYCETTRMQEARRPAVSWNKIVGRFRQSTKMYDLTSGRRTTTYCLWSPVFICFAVVVLSLTAGLLSYFAVLDNVTEESMGNTSSLVLEMEDMFSDQALNSSGKWEEDSRQNEVDSDDLTRTTTEMPNYTTEGTTETTVQEFTTETSTTEISFEDTTTEIYTTFEPTELTTSVPTTTTTLGPSRESLHDQNITGFKWVPVNATAWKLVRLSVDDILTRKHLVDSDEQAGISRRDVSRENIVSEFIRRLALGV